MKPSADDPLFASRPGTRGSGTSPASPASPAQAAPSEPLAARMRPRSLDEFVGQDHIVGPGRLLRRAIQKDQLSSLIFSGPPGTGKTTLARVIANGTKSRFLSLNAVLTGVADIRQAIDEAKKHRELYDRKTILFVDEVHRWNKSQQDALLPWVENGTVVLIGATTENPFFEVNRALVSRSRIFLLKALTEQDLAKAAGLALSDRERGYGAWRVEFAEGALEHLVSTSDGDARSLLNALELAVETSVDRWPPPEGERVFVSMAAAEESIQRRAVLYDKDGDYHYDAASAFIKSIRGSDPDAALYWLARMVYSGEDPAFAFRRMLISAAEDIGMADPSAIGVVSACAQAFDRVGMPEGQFHLTLAALHLATAPKSNSALGYFDALKAVGEEGAEVPDHLKDANRDAKGFGHGEGYQYPHAYRDHWVAQQYLPDSLRNRIFYKPGPLGVEGERMDGVLARREAQLSLGGSPEDMDGRDAGGRDAGASVWSAEGDRRKGWLSRAEGSAAERLLLARSALFDVAAPARTDRILVLDSRRGFYVLEALRKASEGTVAAILPGGAALEQAERMTSQLPDLARPLMADSAAFGVEGAKKEALEKAFGFSAFDLILACESEGGPDSPDRNLSLLRSLREFSPRTVAVEILKARSTMMSEKLKLDAAQPGAAHPGMVQPGILDTDFLAELSEFEAGLSGNSEQEKIAEAYGLSGSTGGRLEVRILTYAKHYGSQEIESWLSHSGSYGTAFTSRFGAARLAELGAWLARPSARARWPLALAFISTNP